MSKLNLKHKKHEDYVGRIGNDMYYPKSTEPQAPPIRPKQAIPEDELAKVIQAFDEVDIRKISDADLRFYMDVAYYSYLYAEALINKRERFGNRL